MNNDTPATHGRLIMFEGADGVGKTTQIRLVQQALEQKKRSVILSRLPGGTPIGEALRTVMMQPLARPAMTDLYIALATQEALIESLDDQRTTADSVVLLDRSPLSIAAYQIYGGNIDRSIGWNYVDDSMKRLAPDLVIVYEVSPEAALARLQHKSTPADYFESKPASYFERVAAGYKEAAQRYHAVVIDASQSIEAVHEITMQHVDQVLAT